MALHAAQPFALAIAASAPSSDSSRPCTAPARSRRSQDSITGAGSLGLVFQSIDEVLDGVRKTIGGAFFVALRLVVHAGSGEGRVEIEVPDLRPVHKVAEQVGQTVLMVAARLLAKRADRLVGPVGAVERSALR